MCYWSSLKKIHNKPLVFFMVLWTGMPIVINPKRSLYADYLDNIREKTDVIEDQDIILAENSKPNISSQGTVHGKKSDGKIKHQSMENVISNLNAEKERLRELEKKYLKLQGATSDSGLEKYFKQGAEKNIDSVVVPERSHLLKTTDKIGIGNTPNNVSENSPSQDLKNEGDLECQQKEEEEGAGVLEEDSEIKPGMSNRLHQYLSGREKEVNPIKIAECFFKLGEYEKALQSYKNIPQENVSAHQYTLIQYQVANCCRYLKKYDDALNEFQDFIENNPDSELVVQAKWYIDDINWWKEWQEKNKLNNNKILMQLDTDE